MKKTRCHQFIGREGSNCTLCGFSSGDHLPDEDECLYATADECTRILTPN
jgi:hypothetical protein